MRGPGRAAGPVGAAMHAAYGAVGALAGAGATVAAAVGGGSGRWAERCGRWDRPAAAGRDPWVWVHGSSLGESSISVALASALRRSLVGTRIVASATTETGMASLRKQAWLESHWFPVDYAPFVERILAGGPPRLLVLVETELWPATLATMSRRGVPVAVVNARLSARSVSSYRLAGPLVRPLVEGLALVCARDEEAAGRWRELGAPDARVVVTGNIKLDLASDRNRRGIGPLLRRRAGEGAVLIAASTHAGEDLVALEAFAAVASARPDVRLILAPRHPGRSADVVLQARGKSLRVAEWSRLRDGDEEPGPEGAAWPPGTDVVVLDRLGLLERAYLGADAAFVGGSLVDGPGGHNLLEPVMAGCPPASGPHLANVADQAALLGEEGFPRIVKDAAELSKFWTDVLDGPEFFLSKLGHLHASVLASAGALGRTVARLEALLEGADFPEDDRDGH